MEDILNMTALELGSAIKREISSPRLSHGSLTRLRLKTKR